MTASVHQFQPRELTRHEEGERLAAVHRYEILDTPPDGSFDRITAMAARLFSVPISIISLVDHDRIWFKSHHGLDVAQIDRGPGLCASAILQIDPWVLTNAKTDIRSLANPLVAGDFGLRFYVGVPLRTHDGFNLGTLCVIDREPRAITDSQIAYLKDLASLVMDQMELRLSARNAVVDLSRAVGEKDAALRRSGLLTKEIEHRVMNSLQLVSTMLTMQARTPGESNTVEALRAAANRIGAIAQAHRHIYLSEDVNSIDCNQYLQRLCNDLSGMLRASCNRIAFEGVEAQLSTDQIVPIGLIVSELVTNAAKHGAGEIKVGFECTTSGGYALTVADQGQGVPATFDPAASPGLGMKVIRSLTEKLGGRLFVDRAEEDSEGTKFTVRFPFR